MCATFPCLDCTIINYFIPLLCPFSDIHTVNSLASEMQRFLEDDGMTLRQSLSEDTALKPVDNSLLLVY